MTKHMRVRASLLGLGGSLLATTAVFADDAMELDEVVVTGTHIRGVAPVGSSLKVYSHEDIERSGAATMDQFARQMTDNFSNVDTLASQLSNASFAPSIGSGGGNQFGGSAFNLRGLGPDATLTLLNGHRLPAAGKDGSVTDSSLIPLTAVDHIETLSDGASAIYGADAVAGIVNIVTRKDFEGAQTAARYGSATAGGAAQVTASQLFGTSWNEGSAFFNYEYDNQAGLDASQRNYIASQSGRYSLLPKNRRNSVFLSGRQDFGDTTVSLDAIYSDRNSRTDLTQRSAVLDQELTQGSSAKQSGVTMTLERPLFADWQGNLVGAYSTTRQESDNFTDVSGAVNETLHTLTAADSHVTELNALANGSLFSVAAGAIKAAIGSSYRQERFNSTQGITTTIGPIASSTLSGTPGAAERHVASAFAELLIPLFGKSNAVPGVQRLEISAAGRYDHYSDFGSTLNPKLGLVWEPVAGVAVRGSFGTSFTAPLLYQTSSAQQFRAIPFPDSTAPGGVTNVLQLVGGNPALEPEKSRSVTAGIDLKPAALRGSSLSLTYYKIDFDNRISTPPVAPAQSNIGNPILAPFVMRNPAAALVQSYFDSPNFQTDFTGQGPAAVQAIFNGVFANLASTQQSGIDLTAEFLWPASVGDFDFSLSGERLLKNEFQAVATIPYFSLLNTFGEPAKWKGRGGMAWSHGPFAATLYVNYVSSYENSLLASPERIDSWTTADLSFAYRSASSPASFLLRDVSLALSIQNVTNARPPYVEIPAAALLPGQPFIPYDPANASPIGRYISLSVTKGW